MSSTWLVRARRWIKIGLIRNQRGWSLLLWRRGILTPVDPWADVTLLWYGSSCLLFCAVCAPFSASVCLFFRFYLLVCVSGCLFISFAFEARVEGLMKHLRYTNVPSVIFGDKILLQTGWVFAHITNVSPQNNQSAKKQIIYPNFNKETHHRIEKIHTLRSEKEKIESEHPPKKSLNTARFSP